MSEVCSLAILEYLIQCSGCLRLEDLWAFLLAKFHQCSDVLSIVGSTPESLEQFIRRQSALFRIVDGYVYSSDIPLGTSDSVPALSHSKKPSSGEFIHPEGAIDSGHTMGSEMEPEVQAVKYFQEHLLRKPERWVPIKRLAGHLSQASPSIRMVVGPQSEFVSFLLRHSLFFRVQGDLVGLSDNIRNSFSACLPTPNNKKKPRPVSFQGMEDPRRRSSFDRVQLPVYFQTTADSSTGPKQPSSETDTIVLSIEECKALLWLRDSVESSSEHELLMGSLLSRLSSAPKCVHGTIGWTQIELKEFIKKYSKVFLYDEASQKVRMHSSKNINLVIVTRNANVGENGVLLAQRGCIFCINRLWGIIDLGFHEHVFFDRSLFKHVTDLSKHFQVKETVFFNAVLAPKESRAKWRATCVWKESDPLANYLQRLATRGQTVDSASDENSDYQDDPDSGLDNSEEHPHSKPCIKYLFDEVSEAFDRCVNAFASIRLAEAWEVQPKQTSTQLPDEAHLGQILADGPSSAPKPSSRLGESRSGCSSPVSELSTLSGIPSITGFADGCSSIRTSSSVPLSESDPDRSRCVCSCILGTDAFATRQVTQTSVSTQTLFTGDIMATKLYHEDVGTVV
ncbi:hypothetical protein X801_01338 [Opisthorchis viverrini]|uniref:Uncharacterized protein n=2 Tax=Opisthorchis viverrini TaxID=6198 RepID=A0A1S8X7W5_OPIVI|nr:hypothetical protein T265_03866 [Opisthorchis viverrini]KER29572.1 hypothetical protein T265_03866 [Opisthorchis viverrini]OON22756.1 hypothetical protein X801_01338 [Opisthorchis viverrini]